MHASAEKTLSDSTSAFAFAFPSEAGNGVVLEEKCNPTNDLSKNTSSYW